MENANQHLDTLVALRKELHQNPEVSGKEVETAKKIIDFLTQYSPDEIICNVGGAGILAIYNGKETAKKVLFRAELDALPIEEVNEFDYKSKTKGVSHKCGHDGHMAVLCGLAMQLHKNRPETGTVILLFQPAEEDGTGAQKVLEEERFLALEPDYVFALHNLPGFPLHQIIVKENTFSCAVQSIIIQLKGITSHAGEPEKGINPALAVAAIITEYHQFIQPDITQKDYCLVTPIYIQMGKKSYGVSAGAGEVHFTVRTNSNEQMKKTSLLLEEIAFRIAKKHQLQLKTKWIEQFYANENNSEAVTLIRNAALKEYADVLEKEQPFSWGEDFGLFTQKYTGAMFGIGSGETVPALHNPDYDFPDAIIPTAVNVFYQIAKQITDAN